MFDRGLLPWLALAPTVLALATDAPKAAPSRLIIRQKESFGLGQCGLPEVPSGARYVDFKAVKGEALSSATLGTQDIETTTVDVAIERGSDPLFVVLISSGPLIWRVSGAVDRVAHLVVSSEQGSPPAPKGFSGWAPDYISKQEPQRNTIASSETLYRLEPLTGVVGLPKAKIALVKSGCPGDYYEKLGLGGEYVKESFFASSILGVSLPSGVLIKAQRPRSSRELLEGRREPALPAGFDAKAWREAVRYWPGGLILVDPRSVVASVPVESYLVLPSQMGLSQLIGSGAVRQEGNDSYRVVRPIPRMPPRMGGAHSVTLTFDPGIPIPPGDPAHSCIVEAGSGRKHGVMCDKGER